MKTIILATEFSTNGNRAAPFAGQLAQDQKASLTIVDAYHGLPDNPAKLGDLSRSIQDTRASSEKLLLRLADILSDELSSDVPVGNASNAG